MYALAIHYIIPHRGRGVQRHLARATAAHPPSERGWCLVAHGGRVRAPSNAGLVGRPPAGNTRQSTGERARANVLKTALTDYIIIAAAAVVYTQHIMCTRDPSEKREDTASGRTETRQRDLFPSLINDHQSV